MSKFTLCHIYKVFFLFTEVVFSYQKNMVLCYLFVDLHHISEGEANLESLQSTPCKIQFNNFKVQFLLTLQEKLTDKLLAVDMQGTQVLLEFSV